MNPRSVAAMVVIAVWFVSLGIYMGRSTSPSGAVAEAATVAPSAAIDRLRAENQELRNVVDRVTAANAELLTRLSALPPAPAPAPLASPVAARIGTPTPQTVQQRMLNNLRQISAARDQFTLENGREPASLDEIVGETKYIRRLVVVNGEDYSQLNLARGQVMTLTTPEGESVSYPGPTPASSRPPVSPRVAELRANITPALNKAMAAYQAANGRTPSNPRDLLPYFSTAQEGADFLEALDEPARAP